MNNNSSVGRIAWQYNNQYSAGSMELYHYREAMNNNGSLNISQNLLVQMMMKKNAPKSIPFQISGLLDQPNVKFDTSGLSSQGIRIPGNIGNKLDGILKNKGIGSVLREIFPIPKTNSNSKPQSSKNTSTHHQIPPRFITIQF